ncbi:MAG TPA: MBL fold metallo-hydrolase [Blastocatellia bacterium]|nr:MBL fold metallo-hydrolase [Blastocatellia bacterium]
MPRGCLRRSLLAAGLALACLFALLAYTFMPRAIDVKAYEAGPPVFHSTDGASISPPTDLTLSLINCGKMISKQSFVYRGGSWSGQFEIGMAAALVRHPKGTLLFDTGFGANVDEHIKTIPALMKATTNYVKETPAAVQLREQGISPDQINMILISHSHWDHVSGWEDFPQVEGWMMKEEVAYVQTLPQGELIKQMAGTMKLREIEMSGGPYENFDRSFDLFGDASVVLVPLPGHTPGSMGMFVNLHSGKRFFFIGDLTWSIEGVRIPAERPWISRKLVDRDEDEVRRSIVKVHQLMNRYPDLIIVPAHDRRVHAGVASFPDVER